MRRIALPVLLLLALAIPLSPAAAASPPDFLLADRDLTDASAMDLAEIQNFLAHKGTLANYFGPDTDGTVRTAAEMIWRVAELYTISPKFLMALIQREQSLIEDPSPQPKQYDWATGFGVCDSCSKDDPNVLVWKGFGKQVESAAKQIRDHYLPDLDAKGTTVSGIGPGVARVIDGVTVVPANRATAVLYTYTPHLNGNLNFANIWKRWFSLAYPDGTLAKVQGIKDVWLLAGGVKRRFATVGAFRSRFQDSDVVTVDAQDLDNYAAGQPIKYPNYSLLQGPDGNTYLLDGDAKRRIASAEVFRKLGFNPEEVVTAAADDLGAYNDGPEITLQSQYPTGSLLQDRKTGGVYWAQDGVKYPIIAREIMDERFPKKPIQPASKEQLASLPSGEPVRFSDGALIAAKGSPTVYVIEHGERRQIRSEAVFKRYGWKWSSVIRTSPAVAEIHPLGEPLDLDQPTVQLATQ
jgi:hypothetical protein